MSFHIVCDSCTDLTEEDIKKGCYTWVPLTLLVDGEEIIDDETFDQADFLAKVAASKESVKSACPAPESYMEAYSKADDIYVVTLSAELSGSYNSAVLGKTLYEEDHGKKNIHVVNSRGAATTQVLIARKIYEYASQGMPFEEVVEKIEEDIKKGCYTWVPLTLLVDGEEIIDDETFDQADFLAKVAASKESVKSACPAPESYMEAYSKADDIYVVTLSAELSGSYNSAVLGKTLYEEDHGKKNIHVVNSRGAATTQVLIARKIYEYASQGMPFEEVVEKIEEYTTSLRTYFVLETLEVLRKNGRLSRLSATIASALNIKPVMIGTRDGIIQKAGQARGMKKALAKMVEYMASEGRDLSGRQFVISHCNCYERAVFVKELIQKNLHAQDVDIVDTKGVSSMYACDGGIIVSY